MTSSNPNPTSSRPPVAPPPPPPGSNKRPILIVAGLIALVAVIVFAVMAMRSGGTPDGQDEGTLPATRANTHVLDNVGANAPTLVEFLDVECEACGSLHPVVQDIRKQYDGKLNYAVRYFPLSGHANAVNSALAVEAAAQQGRIEDMLNKMFETQGQWGEKQVSMAPTFRSYAVELNLDMAKYDAAVADEATLARIQSDYDDGMKMGVKSTPTFFLDGKMLELRTLNDLTDPIEKAIADGGQR